MDIQSQPACTDQDSAVMWISQHGEIDDVITLDAACAIMLKLYDKHSSHPTCELRKLHVLVDLPQSTVLRAVKHLNHAGVLNSTEKLHDPLGATVSLPSQIIAKLSDLTVAN